MRQTDFVRFCGPLVVVCHLGMPAALFLIWLSNGKKREICKFLFGDFLFFDRKRGQEFLFSNLGKNHWKVQVIGCVLVPGRSF